MIELIIDAPHRQTTPQRLVATILYWVGWLLWGYFLFPLFEIGCWALIVRQCSQWLVISGGYPNLMEALSSYLEMVATLALVWIAWVGYNSLRFQSTPKFFPPPPVTRAELSLMFNVSELALQAAQASCFVVVNYDQQGQIVSFKESLNNESV